METQVLKIEVANMTHIFDVPEGLPAMIVLKLEYLRSGKLLHRETIVVKVKEGKIVWV